MLIKALNALTIYYLGRRFLRKRRSDVRAMDENRAKFYAQAWEFAAAQTGSTIVSLGADIFEISNGTRRVRVYLHYSPFEDSVTLRLAENKAIVYRLLAEANVPIPRYIHLKSLETSTAKSFLFESGRPVVVKPAYGTGAGNGVTTNIKGVRSLYQALALSRAFCPEIVLEEQIEGDNYRLLFLDGELLDCIVRRPPTVVGDGLSSIRRLITLENEVRIRSGGQVGQTLIPIDLDLKNTLAAQGMSLRTIPTKGQHIKIKNVINSNRAKENESPSVSPGESLIALGRKISETIGVRLVGIDIITNHLGKDLRDSGGVVIEVNTIPGYYYHYLKKGQGYPVTVPVLQRALEDQNVERSHQNLIRC